MPTSSLIDLEIKLAHQERALEELQKAFFEQQKAIQRLEERVKRQAERIDAAAGGGLDIGPANEKPPHY